MLNAIFTEPNYEKALQIDINIYEPVNVENEIQTQSILTNYISFNLELLNIRKKLTPKDIPKSKKKGSSPVFQKQVSNDDIGKEEDIGAMSASPRVMSLNPSAY